MRTYRKTLHWTIAGTLATVTAGLGFTVLTTRPLSAQQPDGPSPNLLHSLSPLPETPPPDTTNAFGDDARAARLGQRLFFDKAISGPLLVGTDRAVDLSGNPIPPESSALGKFGETGKVACASCHQPNSGWMFDIRSDDHVPGNPHATALGTNWTVRNASSIINTAYYHIWHENDGIADSSWADALTDPEDPHSQNGSRLQVAHVLWNKYREDYNAIFSQSPLPLDPRLNPHHPHAADFPATGKPGDPQWEAMADDDKEIVDHIFANFGKAVQAYLRQCVSRNAPFDRYVAGGRAAISASARRGLALFTSQRVNCVACHNGPLFSDSQFHNIGLRIDTDRSPHADPTEVGRYAAIQLVLSDQPGTTGEFNVNSEYSDDVNTGFLDGLTVTEDLKGKWRTKALRQVAVTAPYMHDGQFATLREVVEFYDRGGEPVGTFFGTKDPLIHPLHLSEPEKNDLIEFLKTLTGEPLPDYLMRDTSAH